MTALSSRRICRTLGVQIDRDAGLIRRGGVEAVRQKANRLLLCPIENRGAPVAKEDLIRLIWGGAAAISLTAGWYFFYSAGGAEGSVPSDVSWTAGVSGNALRFSGADEVVTGSFSNELKFDETPGSMAAWIKTTADHADTTSIFHFGPDKALDSNRASVAGASRIDDDQWHHVVAVFEGASQIAATWATDKGHDLTFDTEAFHNLSVTAQGELLSVSLDGCAVAFDQAGKSVSEVRLEPEWEGLTPKGKNQGAAGIAFGSEGNRDKAGGKIAGNIRFFR